MLKLNFLTEGKRKRGKKIKTNGINRNSTTIESILKITYKYFNLFNQSKQPRSRTKPTVLLETKAEQISINGNCAP